MNARLVVVLRWRAPPSSDKNSPTGQSSIYLNAPVMYVGPTISKDPASHEIASNRVNRQAESSDSGNSAGMRLGSCLTELCKVEEVSISDSWICRNCRNTRDGRRNLSLWRLPDLLTFHLKRYKTLTKWEEKLTTKVNFPLTGLDMTRWCHKDSSAICNDSEESFVYDLVGVVNHHGSLSDGRYNAMCKATGCGRTGEEVVSRAFNGTGMNAPSDGIYDQSSLDESTSFDFAASSEPLWLQFDNEIVQQIPPHCVVSESAYVLFYRRRRLSPANTARYTSFK